MKYANIITFTLFAVMLISIKFATAQSTSTGNLTSGFPNQPSSTSPLDFLGWENTVYYPLLIKTMATGANAQPIEFYTDSTLYLRLQKSGDLDVVVGSKGYKIGNEYVLRHNNTPTSIFVGVESGLANPTGVQNTYVGYKSGKSTTTGYDNTFIGYTAGENDTSGFENCFVGSYAGHDNLKGQSNVFIGFQAGYHMVGSATNLGSWNTIVGFHAGENNYDGKANCYYGKYSGDKNKLGSGNSFYGAHSGQASGDSGVTNNFNCMFGHSAGRNFNSGIENIFIGYNAQNSGTTTSTWNNIDNSVTIGANSLVRTSDKFILGNNKHNIGIGLSADTAFNGPRSRLEINARLNSTFKNGIDGSGLQFRQLYKGCTLNSNSYENPWGKVLTVDTNGIVKLTEGYIGYTFCPNFTLLPVAPNGSIGLNLNGNNLWEPLIT